MTNLTFEGFAESLKEPIPSNPYMFAPYIPIGLLREAMDRGMLDPPPMPEETKSFADEIKTVADELFT